MFVGLGTLANVVTVVVGSLVGLLLGHRLPDRAKDIVTDVLGLVTLLIGGLSAVAVTSPALAAEVGSGAPLLIVLGALLLGALLGSWWQLEARLEAGGEWVRRRVSRGGEASTFVDGFVTATLLFCVGPLAVLGSLSDGLGRGADQLLVKSVMDGFAAMAFASTLGIGVMVSIVPLALYQGSLTVLGALLGAFLPMAHVDALTATGGLVLVALGLRLLKIKAIPVGDLLPSLVVAPLLVALVGAFH